MKKKLIKCLLFVFIFLLFGPKNNLIQAVEISFTARVDVYQESSISPTGRCYGPYYVATKPLLVDIYNMYYDGVPIISPQDADGVNAQHTVIVTKLVRRFAFDCSTTLGNVSNGHLPICDIDVSQYDDLEPNETELREVKVTATDPGANIPIFEEKYPVYIRQWVDETKCYDKPTGGFELCYQIPENQEEAFYRCTECFRNEGIWTAIGCIPQSREGVASTLIQIGLIFGGAIVLIMILAGAFMLSTSQGDPKKTQDAKELITSAIIGLIFIIFSVTILQFIGVTILKIPELGR